MLVEDIDTLFLARSVQIALTVEPRPGRSFLHIREYEFSNREKVF